MALFVLKYSKKLQKTCNVSAENGKISKEYTTFYGIDFLFQFLLHFNIFSSLV